MEPALTRTIEDYASTELHRLREQRAELDGRISQPRAMRAQIEQTEQQMGAAHRELTLDSLMRKMDVACGLAAPASTTSPIGRILGLQGAK